MHYLSTLAVAGVLCAAAMLPHGGIASAASVSQPSAFFSPVVIESFSLSHPRVGQREVVHTQLLNNKKPVAGAHLAATIYLGKKVLMVVHGTTTNSQGKAQASFKVPSAAKGKTLRASVILTYGKHKAIGRNDIKVLG